MGVRVSRGVSGSEEGKGGAGRITPRRNANATSQFRRKGVLLSLFPLFNQVGFRSIERAMDHLAQRHGSQTLRKERLSRPIECPANEVRRRRSIPLPAPTLFFPSLTICSRPNEGKDRGGGGEYTTDRARAWIEAKQAGVREQKEQRKLWPDGRSVAVARRENAP